MQRSVVYLVQLIRKYKKSNTQGRKYLPCNLKQIKIQINLIFQNLIPKNKNNK